MRIPHRIRTIYFKELIDILRDRRTLIAMIVVPIVLYPLLMLGSVQAVSFQAESLEREALAIGVVDTKDRAILEYFLNEDQKSFEEAPSAKADNGQAGDERAESIREWHIEIVGSPIVRRS